MIAQIISKSLFFFQDDYYNADISTIEREMTHISYCIETFPVVNAMVDNQGCLEGSDHRKYIISDGSLSFTKAKPYILVKFYPHI